MVMRMLRSGEQCMNKVGISTQRQEISKVPNRNHKLKNIITQLKSSVEEVNNSL